MVVVIAVAVGSRDKGRCRPPECSEEGFFVLWSKSVEVNEISVADVVDRLSLWQQVPLVSGGVLCN